MRAMRLDVWAVIYLTIAAAGLTAAVALALLGSPL